MNTLVNCVLALVLLMSCSNNVSKPSAADSLNAKYAELLAAAEQAAQQADTLGSVMGRIEFSIAITDQESRVVDHVSWVSIEKTKEQIAGLKNPDNIVLPYPAAKLILDYPLSVPVTIEIKNDGSGFSLKELITAISNSYHNIYKEEEATATVKTVPVDQRKQLLNRNQTDGKYGIWGHDISDLYLTEIKWYRHNGAIYVRLEIES